MKRGLALLPAFCVAGLWVTGCTQNPILRSEPYSAPKNFYDNWNVVDSMVKSGTVQRQQAVDSFRNTYGKQITYLSEYPFADECIIHDPPTQLILLQIKTKAEFEQFLRHLIKDESYIQKALDHYKGSVLALGTDSSSWITLFFNKQGILIEAFGRSAPEPSL